MDLKVEILKKEPYFDFFEAVENYGFDFEEFSLNGFQKLIKEVLLESFIQLRKAFITRDFEKVRFYAHRLKGSFLLMQSRYVADLCIKIQKNIDSGNIFVEDSYAELVKRISEFLEKVKDMADELSKFLYFIV